jgi:hypothetical protein
VKSILLIILACICTNVYAQPKPQVSSTRFTPISEKIKKLPAASSLAKMKPSTGFILSPARMTLSNKWTLSFRKPDLVNSQEVEFYVNDESTLNASTFIISYPANVGGIYVVEMNISMLAMVENFEFKVIGGGVTQLISLANNGTGNTEYYDNKLVFAVTIPNSASFIKILTKSAPWKFRNCEITPME